MKKKKKNTNSVITSLVIGASTSLTRLIIDAVFYLMAAYFLVRVSLYAKDFCYQLFGNVTVSDYEHREEKEIYIEAGESTRDIAKRLEREGLIVNELSFYVKVKINKYNIIPGTYKLNTSMNYNEILDVISVSTEKFDDEEELDDE